jgi:tetratricopeptide (TPR) repeat protein
VDECIAHNRKALEIAPGFAVAHNNLAVAFLRKGETDKAIAHCDEALGHGYEVHPGL